MATQKIQHARQQETDSRKILYRATFLLATSIILAAGAQSAEPPGYMATNASALTAVNPQTGVQSSLIPVSSPVSSLTFSSSGKNAFIVDGGAVNEIDIQNHQVIATFADSFGPVELLLSANNQVLYVYNSDTSVTVYDVASASIVKRLPANTFNAGPVAAILSPDGSTVWLMASYNENIEYLKPFFTLTSIDTHTLTEGTRVKFAGTGAVGLAVTADNTSAFVATGENMLQVNLANGTLTKTFAFPATALLLNGSTLFIAGDASVSAFSTETLQVTGEALLSSGAGGLSISPDKTTLYAYSTLGYDPGPSSVQPISVDTLTLGTPFALAYTAGALAVNPANGFVWSASNNPAVTLSFNAASGALLTVGQSILQGPQPQGLAVAPKAAKIYETDPATAEIDVFDSKTLKLLTAIPITQTFGGGVELLATASPDGSKAFLAYGETIQVVNTATDEIAGVLYVDPALSAVAVSPNSKTIYTAALPGDAEGLIQSFDTTTFQSEKGSCCGLTQNFQSLMVSPNGKTLYAVGPDPAGVNWLYVFNATTLEIESDVQVTGSAALLSKDGATIYVLESPAPNTLAIQAINTSSLAVTNTYPVIGPTQITGAAIALSPDGTELYVSARSPLLSINVTTGVQTNSSISFFGPIVF